MTGLSLFQHVGWNNNMIKCINSMIKTSVHIGVYEINASAAWQHIDT